MSDTSSTIDFGPNAGLLRPITFDEWETLSGDPRMLWDLLVERAVSLSDAINRAERAEKALAPFAKHGGCTCWPYIEIGPGVRQTDPDFNKWAAVREARAIVEAK